MQNKYEFMKLILEIMLRGIVWVVGYENIIQEKLDNLED